MGEQARSFVQQLGAGKDNEGLVATKGMTLVDLVATATPATLAQVEALVNQLPLAQKPAGVPAAASAV